MRLLALLFALVTTPAMARVSDGTATRASPPRFLVVPLDDEARARVEPLYTAIEAAGAESVPRAARAGVDLPLAPALYRDATLDEPRDALLSARAALRELALDEVDARLDEALAHALRLPNPAEHPDLLGDILLLRAELSLARAMEERALVDLRLVARLDERRTELHPGLFPPNVVTAYARARASNAEGGVGYLTLQAEDREASPTLFLDGSEVPLERARAGLELPAGPHLVTLRAEGRVSRSFVVEVTASEPLALEAQLFPAGADEARAEALAALRAAPDDDDVLARLLAASGATAGLVLGGGQAFAFSAARGRVSLVDEGDAFLLARDAVAAAIPPPAVGTRDPPPAYPPPPVDEEVSLWPLALGGGAVLGALVVVTLGGGALAWALQPAEPTSPMPRPVILTCCGQER